MRCFFKVTTISEENSVTESADSPAKLKDSASESEEENNRETLNERIDRLALADSEDDEDFDVSDQVSYFCLTSDIHFLIPDAIVKFIKSIQAPFHVYNQFVDSKKNSVT